jgi:Ca2+-binding RTX toxin-like protein
MNRWAKGLVGGAILLTVGGFQSAVAGGQTTVSRTAEQITATGTGTLERVTVSDGNDGSIIVHSFEGITTLDCTQDTETQVTCPASPLIVFRGRGGNDQFTSNSFVSTEQFGGAGRDILKGGAPGDLLKGQDGRDTLRGRGGPDQLFGGSGKDDCAGGAGTDFVSGCEN